MTIYICVADTTLFSFHFSVFTLYQNVIASKTRHPKGIPLGCFVYEVYYRLYNIESNLHHIGKRCLAFLC